MPLRPRGCTARICHLSILEALKYLGWGRYEMLRNKVWELTSFTFIPETIKKYTE
jgi:hypothetical protein